MSTVRFTLNPSLESFLKEQKSEDAKLALTQKNVLYDTLKSLVSAHNTSSSSEQTVSKLLKGSKIWLPPKTETVRDPVLVARLEKLKANAQQREYNRMTKSVDNFGLGSRKDNDTFITVKNALGEASIPVHIFFTAACGFLFGYFFTWYYWSSQFWSTLTGSFFAIVLMLVDALLLTVRNRKTEIQQEKEDRRPKYAFGGVGSQKLLSRDEVLSKGTAVTDDGDIKSLVSGTKQD